MSQTETDAQMLERMSPLRIVMGRNKDRSNNYSHGVIENSWTMDLSTERVSVWWTGTANTIIGKITIDAQEDAEDQLAYFRRKHPDMEFEILDPRAEDCPICIDIPTWLADNRIGQSRKFQARNAAWTIRE
jgi:hypothetical protein